MHKPKEFFAAQRFLSAENQSGHDIPPYGACVVGDIYFDGTLILYRPGADSLIGLVVFNGPEAIPSGGMGEVTRDYPCLAYAPGVTEGRCGTQTDSFELSDEQAGFWVMGSPIDDHVLINLYW